VIDNIAFGLEMKGVSKEDRYMVAERYLNLINSRSSGTVTRRNFRVECVSGLPVARALTLDPVLSLWTSRLGPLDAQTRNMLQKELLQIWEKTKKMIVFITPQRG